MQKNRIPKVIHYCWFGGKPLPGDVRACIRTWQKVCPGYRLQRWDESNTPIGDWPFAKAAYQAGAWAFVSDFVRLQVINQYGGIYLDTDVELRKSLDPLLRYDGFFARQQSGEINTGLGFGAKAGLEPVRAMLREYETAEFSPKRMQEPMCPVLNTRALERLGFHQTEKPEQKDGVIVLSPEYMDPYSSGDKVENLFCERTISIHHYSASWTSGRQRIKRRLIRIIGEDRLLWIRTMKMRAAAGKQK